MPETPIFDEDRARLIIAEHLGLEGPMLPILHALNEELGYVDSVRENRHGEAASRIRNRFALVPDAPVTSFTLDLKGSEEISFLHTGKVDVPGV